MLFNIYILKTTFFPTNKIHQNKVNKSIFRDVYLKLFLLQNY